MKYFFTHIAQWPLAVGICLLIAAIGLWVPTFLTTPCFFVVLTLLSVIVVGGCVQRWSNELGLIRPTNLMPVVVYVALCSGVQALTTLWIGQIAALIIFLFLRTLGKDLRMTNWVNAAFTVCLPIAILSVWVPQMLWFIPVVWFGWMNIRQFTFRAWLATLIAVALVFIYLWIAILNGWTGCPYTHFLEPAEWQWEIGLAPLSAIQTEYRIAQIPILIISIFLIIGNLVYTINESLQQRHARIQLTWILPIVWLLFAVYASPSMLAIAFMLTTVLLTINVSQRESVARGVFFFIILLLIVLLRFLPTIVG